MRQAKFAAFLLLIGLTGTVFAQLEVPELEPESTPEAAPAFPDPLRLADGWSEALRVDGELDPARLSAWLEQLTQVRAAASLELTLELDPLVANIRALMEPVAPAPTPTAAASEEVNTLPGVLALVATRQAQERERDAAVRAVRLERGFSLEVQIGLNQTRQTYVSTDIEDQRRAQLGYRWMRAASRQGLVDRRLAVLKETEANVADSIEAIEAQLATSPDQLTFNEASLAYWDEQLAALADQAGVDFGDDPLASDMSVKDLTVAAQARADHLVYRIAERAKQFTEVQLGLRESRRADDAAVLAIDQWAEDAQSQVDFRRARLLADIEASSVDAMAVGTQVQLELEEIRSLSEQLNRIAVGQEQYRAIERLYQLTEGFSIFNLDSTWTQLGVMFNEFSESVLDRTLFRVNESPVTGGGILRMLIIIGLAFVISWVLRRMLRTLEKRRNISAPAAYTIKRILHYVLILLGFLIAISSIGIDLSKFALFASALAVGLGFGLQAIIGNFVSGLIILFERSLKIGDFVELESGVTGRVNEINVRGTVITTNDNIDILVPNSEFVNGKVTNWTLRDVLRRLRMSFGVAYGSDKELVKKAALEAAESVPFTLTGDPTRKTQVWLVGFGDSSLDFELVVWVSGDAVSRPNAVDAAYKWAIESKLKKYGIEIPFPQQDLHVRSYFGLTGTEAIGAMSGQQRPLPVAVSSGDTATLADWERRRLEVNDAAEDTLRSIEEAQHEKERAQQAGEDEDSDEESAA